MDIITQGILGAAVGYAVLGRKKPRTALTLGFLGGLAPDFDVFLTTSSSVDFWRLHRGLTHSLFFGPVVGLGLAWLSVRIEKWRQSPPAGYWLWYEFWALVLVTHPMLDGWTMYGTQLLAPFSDYPYAVPGVSIIDPVYSLPLLGVIVYAFFARRSERAMRAVIIGLVVTTLYLGLSFAQNPRAAAIATQQLKSQNIAITDLQTYTTIFSPWLQRLVITLPDGRFRVGFVSTLNPQPIRWVELARDDAAEALAQTVADTPEGRIFHNFARGPKVAAFYTRQDGVRELRISDARYGFPGGDAIDGFWGIAFPLDADGKVTGAGTRFMRERGNDLANIGALFRAKFGLPQNLM